jgi:hypothetical protein
MSKIYIFGIGGTGSRVLKSLTMLLASGIKLNADEIVPVIIDPDSAAADLTRAVKLMKNYNLIYNKVSQNSASKNGFFRSKINLEILPSVKLKIENTADYDFSKYIALSEMKDSSGKHNANYALASMLFSDKNLKSKMDVGFKGNPNIGSVVLNQIGVSNEFRDLVSSFKQGDKVFIISSIFGGTGASGFPLILKNLRAISKDKSGNAYAKNSIIGAVSVLPYFDIKPDPEKSQIDSSTFISKTKAALTYYDRNMTEANVMYYIADVLSKQYNNSEGGTTQQNDAHLVEMIAALSIIDFSWKNGLETNDGKPSNTIFKEFGIKKAVESVTFSELDEKTQKEIKKPLTQLTLFFKYLNEQFSESYGIMPWAIDHKFDDSFMKSTAFKSNLSDFKSSYMEWLEEMAKNVRAFAPFDLASKKDKLFELIIGELPLRSGLFNTKKNYALYDDTLNGIQESVKDEKDKELQSFIELFYLATEKIVKSKFRI